MTLSDEQEHEVYGGDIPEEEEGEMETDEYEEYVGEEGAAAGGDEELEPGSASRVLCFLSIQLYFYPIDPSYCIVLSLLLWFRYRI